MVSYYGSFSIVVVSLIFYQLIQKLTPTDVNPVLSIFISYIIAGILCIIAFPHFQGNESMAESLKKVNWASFALGAAVFGIELGYLLTYRAGWNISTANLLSASSVSLILIIIGILIFHEKLSLINALGVGLCFVGLIMIKIK